ncbi:chromate resistance protein ChrB domain-containing protein [Aquirhabdus sp.]|uniref:chromate resistance protein ChrB domain-containing protein n=1 Tax=Aquirhabdus sp. TaxID=2824160 RepID=UPI00396CEEC0
MTFILLILTLPTQNATARMRAWRTLKASGAAVLRDGVYILPDQDACRATLHTVAIDVNAHAGSAYVLDAHAPEDAHFESLFDRSPDYAALLNEVIKLREPLTTEQLPETIKQTRKLRKQLSALIEIDFFPNESQPQVTAALQELELHIARSQSPDEPQAVNQAIPRRLIADYQGKFWATRQHPWVDRLACAWLIKRYIDPLAQILWLTTPLDCPANALGFDFDGATFSHVGNAVSFEVLLTSFGLMESGLQRLAALVHYLDVGGVQPAEAIGIESVLTGLRQTIHDDDQLLAAALHVFDGLLAAFENGESTA